MREMRKFIGGKPRAIAAETYRKFARKYGIKAGGTLGQTAQKIYDHEHRTGVQKGLYLQPKKISKKVPLNDKSKGLRVEAGGCVSGCDPRDYLADCVEMSGLPR